MAGLYGNLSWPRSIISLCYRDRTAKNVINLSCFLFVDHLLWICFLLVLFSYDVKMRFLSARNLPLPGRFPFGACKGSLRCSIAQAWLTPRFLWERSQGLRVLLICGWELFWRVRMATVAEETASIIGPILTHGASALLKNIICCLLLLQTWEDTLNPPKKVLIVSL
jgi:hypothetical protein